MQNIHKALYTTSWIIYYTNRLVPTPVGFFFFAGLMGLAYLSHKKHKQTQAAYQRSDSLGAGVQMPGEFFPLKSALPSTYLIFYPKSPQSGV